MRDIHLDRRAGIHGPKPVGPGPSGSVLVLGTDRTRTRKNRKLGPDRNQEANRTLGPDQDQENWRPWICFVTVTSS